jgi:carbamoyltransferase
MKLLALRVCEHDSNISYFDGVTLRYYKTERNKQSKHHAYKNLWEWRNDIKELWNVDYQDLDEIAIVIDPWRHNLPCDNESFFPAIEYEFLPASCKVWRINHHYAHSLSTWMLQDRDPDVSFVIDGFGDKDKAWTVFKDNTIVEEGSHHIHGSIGTEMAQAGRYLGVEAEHGIDIAGKVMGLQSYGTVDYEYLQFLKQFDIYSIIQIFSLEHWIRHKGDPLISRLTPLDWITTVHHRVGEVLLEFFQKHANPDDVISYTGGVAQNVVWNSVLKKHFKNLIIPPHSPDDGLSLGAIEWLRRKNQLAKFNIGNFPYIQSDQKPAIPTNDTIKQVAVLLAEGKTVGWFQGHGEIGPRALGNRSILMDPRITNGKEKINIIKKRENYRPFGASILVEHVDTYFDSSTVDAYMLLVTDVKTNDISAVTHIDKTCRVQSVDMYTNPIFYALLTEFYKLTGCPVLLNTSLNAAGRPLAASNKDAEDLFMFSNLDCLVVGNTCRLKDQ